MNIKLVWLGILLFLGIFIFSSNVVAVGTCTLLNSSISCYIFSSNTCAPDIAVPNSPTQCSYCECITQAENDARQLAQKMADCTAANGIFCDDGKCVLPFVPDYDEECVVSNLNAVNGIVTINVKDPFNAANPTVWTMKKLTVNSGVILWFVNTATPVPDVTPLSNKGCDSADRTKDSDGGDSGQSYVGSQTYCPDATAGGGAALGLGDGGKGYYGDNKKGGGGGGGGGGGIMFQAGAAGGKGSSGDSGQGGADGANAQPRKGANVILILQDLVLNGDISVSGSSGVDNIVDLGKVKDAAGGGGGGGGGSGAGRLNFTVTNTFSGYGHFIAAGGNGGHGSGGGIDNGGADSGLSDGCFGGGGGGGAGGEILYSLNSPDPLPDTYFVIAGGLGGKYGIPNECSMPSPLTSSFEVNYIGSNGKDGSVHAAPHPSTETHVDSDYLPYFYCNNGVSDDADHDIDMNDSDCRSVPEWDASIWGIFTSAQKNSFKYDASSRTGLDLACGDDLINFSFAGFGGYNYLGDYGFILNDGTRKQFLCYSNDVFVSTTPFYKWLDATANPYKIKIVANASKYTDVDVVSNSENWFYCNATKRNLLNGIPIEEGKSFVNTINNGKLSCAFIYGLAFTNTAANLARGAIIIFNDSCPMTDFTTPAPYNCCDRNLDNSIRMADYNNPDSCQNHCYQAGHVSPESDLPKIVGTTTNPDVGTASSSECSRDVFTGCTSNQSANPNPAPVNTTALNPAELAYLNLLKANYYFVSNESFICYKENNNDIISECCYENSCNNYNRNAAFVSRFNGRVADIGSSIHTIENFDAVSSTSINFTTSVRNFTILPGKKFPVTSFNNYRQIPFENFSYLEFDVRSSSETLYLTINGDIAGSIDEGLLFGHSTSGSRPFTYVHPYVLWHHIIINLTDSFKGKSFNDLTFSDSSNQPVFVRVDNIALTSTGTNLNQNTKNYYCSGSGVWLSDLDPKDTDIDVKQYAPYKVGCRGIASYDWTGRHCCGDDTTLTTTEYFNDTEAACFSGSIIFNNTRVFDGKGYLESTNKSITELENYYYRDLLFVNNTFRACQVNNTKYSDFKITFDGLAYGNNLIAQNITEQCKVNGEFYCKDGAWRRTITTIIPEDNIASYGNVVNLKVAPSGIELIKNGFRGGK